MACDEHVVRSDRSPVRLELGAHPPVRCRRPQVEVQDLDLLDQGVDARVVRAAAGAVVGSEP